MAQHRDYRHWDEDWRGRRSQGEGEGGGRMESGFGDRGPNRYGGRDEWRASSFGPHTYGGQDDTSWRGRDEDRWSRGWGGGEREHSGWGERSGRGEFGGSGFGGGEDWGDRRSSMGSGSMGSGGMGSGGMGSGSMGSGSGYDWAERDRWRGREQGQFSAAGLTGAESGYFGGGPRRYGEYRGEYRGDYPGGPGRGSYAGAFGQSGSGQSGSGQSGSGQSGYGYGYGGRPGSYGERSYGGRGGEERGFWDRASDEVQSWFGDEEAQHRRERDYERDHRGRGPRGYTRSDERIREDVCDRLEQDPRVDASDVDVKVSGGEVSLTGQVDSRMARRRAEDCAEMISGVRHVQNNLRVQEYRGAMGSGVATGGSSGGTSATGSSTSSGSRATGSTSGSTSGGSSGQSGTSGQKPGS